LLGCLPMLLQMPVWVAMWQGLQAEVALRQQAFLPVWITDLSRPDALVSWAGHPLNVPLLSSFVGPITGFNLVPILLGVFMYLQQKLMPMSPTSAASPEQRKQQKMMSFMMTAMFLLIFYNMSSALTLYMMGSIGGGVLESWVIRRHIRHKEALEAAGETRVDMPGRAPRGQRPKKPKGPFKFLR
jgi:YidC/Oxa1 family membrane protein insertase